MMDRVLQILGNNTAVGQLSGRQPDIIKMYYGQVVTHKNDVIYHRPIIKNLITGTVSV